MSISLNKETAVHIVQECFPKASKIQIEENFDVEGYQHYVSDVVCLNIKYEEDGVESRKSLILKVPKDGVAGTNFSGLGFLAREPFVYENTLPRINDNLDESLTPVYYATIDSKIVVLENLVKIGYDGGETPQGGENNRQLCGLNQCFPILKALAHFHAGSHKALQTEPDLLQPELLQYATALEFRQCMSVFWEPVLIELLARNEASLIAKLRKANLYLTSGDNEIVLKSHHTNFKFNALNHGDFRKDNVLLKYGLSDSVEGVKIIDFQTCFWSTPAYDFMYFVIASTTAEVTDNYYEVLVDWYLKCLNEKLNKLNCTRVYRRQDFEEDIRKLRLGFIFHVELAALMVSPLNPNHLLDEIIEDKKDKTDYYIETCLKDEIFTSKVLSNLRLCDKLGFFEPA